MAEMGVSLFTNRQPFCATPSTVSWQILWTNETGSTGGRDLKKTTRCIRPWQAATNRVRLTTLRVQFDRSEQGLRSGLLDLLDLLSDFVFDITLALVGILAWAGPGVLVVPVDL